MTRAKRDWIAREHVAMPDEPLYGAVVRAGLPAAEWRG